MSNRPATAAWIATIAFCASTAPVAAAHETALAKVAAQLGYTYSYLGPEDAVALTRSGVTVVVRPGERLFDVNDRTEAMDGPAPRFSRDDVYVSDALVDRLRTIARFTAPAAIERREPVRYRDSQAAAAVAPVTGSITGLVVAQIPGQQAVSVAGKSPANVPITITLVSTMSSELPDTVLSRERISSDAHGSFATNVSIAPGYFRGSIITAVASSSPGVAPARARVEMRPPNQDLKIPADDLPRSIR